MAAWVAPTVGTVIYLWGGRPFLAGGIAEVRTRRPGMMLLITLAISVAYGSSLATSLGWGELDYWWELAALIVVMLLGHWQEMKAIGRARGALAALAELLPDTAERVVGDSIEEAPLRSLTVGDIVLVRPGGRVPADGTLVDGRAAIDESMITGESAPVTRSVGAPVVAGMVSTDSSVRVRFDAVGGDTALAGIQRLVADAQASQSRVQALADRAAAGVASIIELSKATYAKMIQNLVWATAYNLLAIPIAAGVFAFAGVNLPPAAAAVAMSTSTLVVAANAQLLRRLDLRPKLFPADRAAPTHAMVS